MIQIYHSSGCNCFLFGMKNVYNDQLVATIITLAKEKDNDRDHVDSTTVKEMVSRLPKELCAIVVDSLPHWTDWVSCCYASPTCIDEAQHLHKRINSSEPHLDALLQNCTKTELTRLHMLSSLHISRWRSYCNYTRDMFMSIVWYILRIMNSVMFRAALTCILVISMLICAHELTTQLFRWSQQSIIIMMVVVWLLCTTWDLLSGACLDTVDRYFSSAKLNYDTRFERYSYGKLLCIKDAWREAIYAIPLRLTRSHSHCL